LTFATLSEAKGLGQGGGATYGRTGHFHPRYFVVLPRKDSSV
jgi:hypothetical protein